MLTPEKLSRLNELAKKKKEGTLTEEEMKEQQALREEYLLTFRESMKNTIENMRVIDPNGDDVTPEKVKKIQEERGTVIH
ncbi:MULTISPECIES: DUF896 domain-containing protein [Turicibacter]|uniref:UPF0291 protein GMA92_02575 n=3 Tax=Turicibacter sanguinis TaxID=154288 RepID=A0A173T6D3_9FIRM|nr:MULTISPECIES: DUF896 domain-containing protein [Turicibacter]EFF63031.1 conserved hypothetical protein [Turicibacter sanguinis PC909]EGC91306.1 hypothetical protein HMPREF9402_1657 [Turicibacter sp. HGF1]MBP3904165.1 DUF896 domain-containing protein [Turicibacter sp.]MCU7191004.1 DUF896 domain-containing protein [Turicibacter sanguinis]MCU7197087.1 DUF896 domain-containing protein [Turicibacter sanguinis]